MLPSPVIDLAAQLGAQADGKTTRSAFEQSGTLRTDPEGDWMPFSAAQWISLGKTSFCWPARTGPMGAIRVEDSLVGARPTGAVTLLGLIPLQKAKPSADLLKGQLMRCLAELPWAPDAILRNPALSWRVDAPDRLSVSTQVDGVSGEVTFTLDAEGLPASVDGVRPREEDGRFTERPWHGRFFDFREAGGRMVPHGGAVAWTIDGVRCEVWRGTIEDWHMTSAER